VVYQLRLKDPLLDYQIALDISRVEVS